MNRPERILVVRNDKLGDLCLALPVFELLARALPEARRLAFVPAYTREVVELSPYVDEVVLDRGVSAPGGSARELARLFRGRGIDAVLCLWSTPRLAWACFLAGIPLRVAPATKLWQFLYNARLVQRRSASTQPEFAYNNDLARHLVGRCGASAPEDFTRPVLRFPAQRVSERRAEVRSAGGFESDAALVYVHVGHGGSSNNLDLEQYARLLSAIESPRGHGVVITAGPGELEAAQALAGRLPERAVHVHESRGGLAEFALTLAAAELVIGSSTGPLHLAGALDTPTAGFYVRRNTSSPLRWRTLNSEGRWLSWAPPPEAAERDLGAIDLLGAAREISAFLAAGAGGGSGAS